jgi:hypothetical protein
VAITMSQREQKELRAMSKECRCPLRNILQWAVRGAKSKLEEMVDCQRKTGLSLDEMGLQNPFLLKLN